MKFLRMMILSTLFLLTSVIQWPQSIEGSAASSIRLSSTSVQTGQRARIFVQGQNLNNIEAFQLQIFFDDTQLTLAQSFTYSYVSSRGTALINTAEAGVITISFAGTTALSGSSNLFYFDFDVAPDAPIKNYPLFIGIQEALGVDFAPVEINGVRGNIEVTERTTTLRNAPISTSINRSRAEEGDTFTISLNLNHSVLKSAGSFDIFYDDQVLNLLSSTVGSLPSASQTLVTVNDQFRGKVHFNFISLNGINSVWPILTLEFEVIKDVQTSTNIQVIPIQILDMDLQPLQTVASTRALQIIKKPPTLNIPSVVMESKTLTSIDDFTVDLSVEQNSNLAIGVFEIEFNPFLVEFKDLELLDTDWAPNILTFYTLHLDEGLIRFTYINPAGVSTAKAIARLYFSPLQNEVPIHTQIEVRLPQALNANYQAIVLAERSGQIHLSNQYQVRMYHQGQLIQEETVDDMSTINYPQIDAESGLRFAFWESAIQGQTISYHSRFYRLGDLNEDGVIDENDIGIFRQALVGTKNLTALQVRAANLKERDLIESSQELTLKDLVILQLKLQEQSQQNSE